MESFLLIAHYVMLRKGVVWRMLSAKNKAIPGYISTEAQRFYERVIPISQTTDFSDSEAVSQFRKAVHSEWAAVTADIEFPFYFQEIMLDGVRAVRISTDTTRETDRVILLAHGGAYVLGTPEVNASSAILLAQATGIPVISVDYRLAPEHPFPAALNDVTDSFLSLLESGYAPDQIVMVGESAGAGLAVSSCLLLRDKDLPLPGGLVLLSVWADLEGTGDSVTTLIDADLDFATPAALYDCGPAYAVGHDLGSPLISPVNASLEGFPPLCIQVGAREMLLSDSLRLASNGRDAGVEVSLDVWDGMGHMFQALPALPESQKAYSRIANFVARLA